MSAPVINFAHLNMMKEVGQSDPDFVFNLIQIFLDTTPPQHDELKKALASRDAEKISRTAHGLQSSYQNVGADQLVSFCSELYSQSRQGDISQAPRLIENMMTSYESVAKVLEEIKRTKSLPKG